MVFLSLFIKEILTLDVPYAHIKSDGMVARAILEGRLPVKHELNYSAELRGDIWSLCRKCCTLEQRKRPSMQDVLYELMKSKYRFGVGVGEQQLRAES